VAHGPGPLPDWPFPDVLARTEVQVMVDGQGRVLSAVVLGESGLPAADARALQAAHAIQFGPTPEAAPVSGLLEFFWRTAPTNAPAMPPKP
jgi:TonB family protein